MVFDLTGGSDDDNVLCVTEGSQQTPGQVSSSNGGGGAAGTGAAGLRPGADAAVDAADEAVRAGTAASDAAAAVSLAETETATGPAVDVIDVEREGGGEGEGGCSRASAAAGPAGTDTDLLEVTNDSPGTAAGAVVDVCDEEQGEAGGAPVLEFVEDEGMLEDEEPVEVETGVVCPRRAVVTPLRVLLFMGMPEVSNRILRKCASSASIPFAMSLSGRRALRRLIS